MAIALGPELWTAGVIGAGACGYLIGEFRGATRQFVAHDVVSEEFDNLLAFAIPEKLASPKLKDIHSEMADPVPEGTAQLEPAPTASKTPENEPAHPQQYDYVNAFADMPPLEELRAEVRQILETKELWSDRESAEPMDMAVPSSESELRDLVDEYRQSIDQLRKANARQRRLSDAGSSSGSAANSEPAEPDMQVNMKTD